MRLKYIREARWYMRFFPHPAGLLPIVLAPSGQCNRWDLGLQRCTFFSWLYWGAWQVEGSDGYCNILCCVPVWWWSCIWCFQKHFFQWIGADKEWVMLHHLCLDRIYWGEDIFLHVTSHRLLSRWFMLVLWWWRVQDISQVALGPRESAKTGLDWCLVKLYVHLEMDLDVGWRYLVK